MVNSWDSDPRTHTVSGILSIRTADKRAKVADFYAKAFAAKGKVTQVRNEDPWTIEVRSADQSEIMTLNLEVDEDTGGTSGLLTYGKDR